MTCQRCGKAIIEGVRTGLNDELVTCWPCVRRAARRSRILGYLDQIHESLRHAGAIEDCRTCEVASILEPVK